MTDKRQCTICGKREGFVWHAHTLCLECGDLLQSDGPFREDVSKMIGILNLESSVARGLLKQVLGLVTEEPETHHKIVAFLDAGEGA